MAINVILLFVAGTAALLFAFIVVMFVRMALRSASGPPSRGSSTHDASPWLFSSSSSDSSPLHHPGHHPHADGSICHQPVHVDSCATPHVHSHDTSCSTPSHDSSCSSFDGGGGHHGH